MFSVSAAILCLLLGLAIQRWILQPAFLSPLASIPNAHWSSHFSGLWITYHRWIQNDTLAVHQAHERNGAVIRLAPNEISVNDLEGLRTVYTGGFDKNDWYANVFSNYGIRPMFAMSSSIEHGKRKKALGTIYAKSTLLSSPALRSITTKLVQDRLIPLLHDLARTGEAVEFFDICFALAIDYVSTYCFGLSAGSDLLQQPTLTKRYRNAYKTRVKYVSLPQEAPGLTKWLGKHQLLPYLLPRLAADRSLDWDSEAWALQMQDAAEDIVIDATQRNDGMESGDWPTVYAQVRNSLLAENDVQSKSSEGKSTKSVPSSIRLIIASEMVDHIFAGFDTGSIVLLFLSWELSKPGNAIWQERLRSEVSRVVDIGDAKALDKLQVLHAVITETLRLYAPVSGNQVRVTPSLRDSTLHIAGRSPAQLPPNVRIHAQAYSLHRNPAIFPQPSLWNPDRWITSTPEQLKVMHRWFWAFGSGPRMCAGNNFAMVELKAVTASIWKAFETEIVSEAGMVQNRGFLGGPLGSDGVYLKLRLQNVEQY